MYLNLNDLIQYRNDKIILRYQKDYPNAQMPAQEAWQELMKFIWLCHKHKADQQHHPQDENLNFSCVIHAEMMDIDYMWHTFLLFTKDYQEFCQNYLNGIFFHHEPLLDTNEPISEENYARDLTRYLSYIYDNLGENTVLKWFRQAAFS